MKTIMNTRVAMNGNFKIFRSTYKCDLKLSIKQKLNHIFLDAFFYKGERLLDMKQAIIAGKSPIGVKPQVKYTERGSARLALQASL